MNINYVFTKPAGIQSLQVYKVLEGYFPLIFPASLYSVHTVDIYFHYFTAHIPDSITQEHCDCDIFTPLKFILFFPHQITVFGRYNSNYTSIPKHDYLLWRINLGTYIPNSVIHS